MKKAVYLFLFISYHFDVICQNPISQFDVKIASLELEKKGFEQILNDENVKQSKKQILIEKASFTSIIKPFSIKSNANYIDNSIDLLKSISDIDDDISVLSSFSNEDFYTSFKNCDCSNGPIELVNVYKNRWNKVSEKVKSIVLIQSNFENDVTKEIGKNIDLVKEDFGRINDDKIKKTISGQKDAINFIAVDVIPINALTIKGLQKSISSLKINLYSFIKYVKQFQPFDDL